MAGHIQLINNFKFKYSHQSKMYMNANWMLSLEAHPRLSTSSYSDERISDNNI